MHASDTVWCCWCVYVVPVCVVASAKAGPAGDGAGAAAGAGAGAGAAAAPKERELPTGLKKLQSTVRLSPVSVCGSPFAPACRTLPAASQAYVLLLSKLALCVVPVLPLRR